MEPDNTPQPPAAPPPPATPPLPPLAAVSPSSQPPPPLLLTTSSPSSPPPPDMAALEQRKAEIEGQLSKMDDNNPVQFRARQLLEKEMRDVKRTIVRIRASASISSKSTEESATGEKQCLSLYKELYTDESIRTRPEGARKKKRGCLEHITEQKRRLEELKAKMLMQEATHARMQEVLKTIVGMRATMQVEITELANKTKAELAIIKKKLEHHEVDLAYRKDAHTRYHKEHQAYSNTLIVVLLNTLTNILLYILFFVAMVRDKWVRPTKAYFSRETIEPSAEVIEITRDKPPADAGCPPKTESIVTITSPPTKKMSKKKRKGAGQTTPEKSQT